MPWEKSQMAPALFVGHRERQSELDAARARLKAQHWVPRHDWKTTVRSFVADYWAEIRGHPIVLLISFGLTFLGASGLAILNDAHRWQWIALALLAVVGLQLHIAYRRSLSGKAWHLKQLDALISEGMNLAHSIDKPRQAWHDPFAPANPDRGHPDAIRAVDFVGRAQTILPASYRYELSVALPSALARYDEELASRAQAESDRAATTGETAHPVYGWPWPVWVDSALKVLSEAHKELNR